MTKSVEETTDHNSKSTAVFHSSTILWRTKQYIFYCYFENLCCFGLQYDLQYYSWASCILLTLYLPSECKVQKSTPIATPSLLHPHPPSPNQFSGKTLQFGCHCLLVVPCLYIFQSHIWEIFLSIPFLLIHLMLHYTFQSHHILFRSCPGRLHNFIHCEISLTTWFIHPWLEIWIVSILWLWYSA